MSLSVWISTTVPTTLTCSLSSANATPRAPRTGSTVTTATVMMPRRKEAARLHRELDPVRSQPERPFQAHARANPVQRGVSTRLDIEIWPSATLSNRF